MRYLYWLMVSFCLIATQAYAADTLKVETSSYYIFQDGNSFVVFLPDSANTDDWIYLRNFGEIEIIPKIDIPDSVRVKLVYTDKDNWEWSTVDESPWKTIMARERLAIRKPGYMQITFSGIIEGEPDPFYLPKPEWDP